jgi:cysteine-rich repeat protein
MRTATSFFLALVSTWAVGCSDPGRTPDAPDGSVDDGAVDTGGDGGGTFDCAGKADGTDCGGGSICLKGACSASKCGDGYVNAAAGEECEDGNTTGGDGCTSCHLDCKADTDCDDKNSCTTDTCDKTDPKKPVCKVAAAGDGKACKRTDGSDGQCKDTTCVKAGCGNKIVDSGEDCDDGNTDDSDGCKTDCTFSCKADADCDDGDACTGKETCDTATHKCVGGTTVKCDAGGKVGCSGTCDPTSGKCAYPDSDKDGVGCDLDCNDADPAMFPGAFECKDGKDNDCNASTVDSTSPSCLCYQDPDKDGYAVSGAATLTAVTCPADYTRRAPVDASTSDCQGSNVDVHPGQSSYFAASYCSGLYVYNPITKLFTCSGTLKYDYNCDGTDTKRYGSLASASGCSFVSLKGLSLCLGSGWTGTTVPACGAKGTYRTCSLGKLAGTCVASSATLTQECH